VLPTRESIGCVAAAITLGLVDKNQGTPLRESLVYTDIMKGQAPDRAHFIMATGSPRGRPATASPPPQRIAGRCAGISATACPRRPRAQR